MCFAGETILAYPMMLQVQAALYMHARSLSRAVDLYDFKGHVLEVINGMREQMSDFAKPKVPIGEEKTFLILAGYSWRRGDFAIWTLHLDAHSDVFTFRPATIWRGVHGRRLLAVAGDCVDEAKERLRLLLRERRKLTKGGFDMEPLEVLRDIIRGDPTWNWEK